MQNKVKNAIPEERERAVRPFREHRGDYPTDWKAMQANAPKVNRTPETLRMWVRRAEINAGKRPGTTDEMSAENKRLKRENLELKRANEILKAASVFFATELDGPRRK